MSSVVQLKTSMGFNLLGLRMFIRVFCLELLSQRGTRWGSWLRHHSTSRKVAGIFRWHIPTFQPLYGPGVDSVSNRYEYQEYFLECKGGRCLGLTTLHLHVPTEIWEPQPPGTLRACPGLYRVCFTFTVITEAFQVWFFHQNFPTICIDLQAPRFLYIGQEFRCSPEKAFYIFNQQIYFIIWYLLDRASLI